jgi:uncharacterized protein (DUF2252 family)
MVAARLSAGSGSPSAWPRAATGRAINAVSSERDPRLRHASLHRRHVHERPQPEKFQYARTFRRRGGLQRMMRLMLASKSKIVTRAERRELGRSCRNKIRRVDQGNWNPKDRKYDVVDLLLSSQHGRMPSLLPIKWSHMAASPFGFFRGAVPLMAADLAPLLRTELMAQICGDAHVQNLGAFEAPDGRLIFDINDFDESIIGPWEWDVKRMAASLVLAGREAGNSDKQCRNAVLAFARWYRIWMHRFSKMPVVELARFQIYREIDPVRSVLRKAERATPMHNLEKLTVLRAGKHVFCDQKPTQYHVSKREADQAVASLRTYPRTLLPERADFFQQYQAGDVAFRVVGTGSVGLRDYIVLMFAGAISDPLFIQIKEEPGSAYAPYLPHSPVAKHEGQRVAEGGRAMQMQSDIFLGWTSIGSRHYVVRQLRDHKAGIEEDDLKGRGLVEYAEMCGELLSKGHARSGDSCAIAGYLGNSDKYDQAMAAFGLTYANQTVKDWEALRHAIRLGKIHVAKGAAPTKAPKHK